MDITEIKNTMEKLLDKKFISELFASRLPKFFPQLQKINNIESKVYKRRLGKSSMVVVAEYVIDYQGQDSQAKKISIFTSAHSDNSRAKAFYNQSYLYNHGFASGHYLVGRPLFYVPEQFAFFYEASLGRTLRKIIKEAPGLDLGHILKLAAQWAKRLHACPIDQDHQLKSFDIQAMSPRPERFLQDLQAVYPELGERLGVLYEQLVKLQNDSSKDFSNTIVHGDYHPENIIFKTSLAEQVKVIDFTDLSLGDPMLDLGSFVQQLDFMCLNLFSRQKINDLKKQFLEYYFDKSFDLLKVSDISRINIYQAWAIMRTTLLLFYAKSARHSLTELINEIEQYINLAQNKKKQINLY